MASPSENTFFLAHSLASSDTPHKGQEWKYRKLNLLCLHLYLLPQRFHLHFTDSPLFTPAKLRLHFFLCPQTGSSFQCLEEITIAHYRTGWHEGSQAGRPHLLLHTVYWVGSVWLVLMPVINFTDEYNPSSWFYKAFVPTARPSWNYSTKYPQISVDYLFFLRGLATFFYNNTATANERFK